MIRSVDSCRYDVPTQNRNPLAKRGVPGLLSKKIAGLVLREQADE